MRFLVFIVLLLSTSAQASIQEPPDLLSTGPHSLKKAFELLALTESGKELSKKLTPVLKEERLKILSTRTKEAEGLGLTDADAGVYHQGRIFLDEKAPLIALLATLAHEGEHAVEYLLEAGGTEKENALKKVSAESIAILMKAEKRGYQAQNVFLSQLIEKFPHAAKAVDTAVRNRYLVAYPVKDEELREIFIDAMGLPANQVESFFSKRR